MGRISGTAKKLQTVAETAETLYRRVEELRAEVNALRGGVQETNETTKRIEQELAGQRAVLRALAAEQGVDTDALLDEVMADDSDTTTETAETPENEDGPTQATGENRTGDPGASDATPAESSQHATANAENTAAGPDETPST